MNERRPGLFRSHFIDLTPTQRGIRVAISGIIITALMDPAVNEQFAAGNNSAGFFAAATETLAAAAAFVGAVTALRYAPRSMTWEDGSSTED